MFRVVFVVCVDAHFSCYDGVVVVASCGCGSSGGGVGHVEAWLCVAVGDVVVLLLYFVLSVGVEFYPCSLLLRLRCSGRRQDDGHSFPVSQHPPASLCPIPKLFSPRHNRRIPPTPTTKAFVEPASILAILVLNAAVGVWQTRSAQDSLDALKKLQPDSACVVRDGESYNLLCPPPPHVHHTHTHAWMGARTICTFDISLGTELKYR